MRWTKRFFVSLKKKFMSFVVENNQSPCKNKFNHEGHEEHEVSFGIVFSCSSW